MSIRWRLTLTYSLVVFGISAALLAVVYFALSASVTAAPLNPVTVKKFAWKSDGTIVYKPGEQMQVADIETVQQAVNYMSLTTLRTYSIVALVAMFVLAVAVGWWVAGRALRPVGAITRATQEITAGDLSHRIGATGPHDELRTLADTIDGMLDRLERGFRAERALVEDVSHELRNPVAVVQANVEAVLGNERSTKAERAAATDVVLGSTRRMTRLLEDLLATARTRSESFTDRLVDLGALAVGTAGEYRAVAEQRGVHVVDRVRTAPSVFGDPDALGRAIGNLLSNAARLAPTGSTVTVAVGSASGWAWVAVRDEGPGITGEAVDRVFDRFWRGSGADRHGAGLGLAIARQIVESHEGRLRLVSRGAAGSTFVVWLPDRTLGDADRRDGEPPSDDPTA